jgi:hypothetical protein
MDKPSPSLADSTQRAGDGSDGPAEQRLGRSTVPEALFKNESHCREPHSAHSANVKRPLAHGGLGTVRRSDLAQDFLEVQGQSGRGLKHQNPNRLRGLARIACQDCSEPPAPLLINLDQ